MPPGAPQMQAGSDRHVWRGMALRTLVARTPEMGDHRDWNVEVQAATG